MTPDELEETDELDESSIVSAGLYLSGRDFDLAECTRSVGLAPTGTWTQTHPAARAVRSLPTQQWWIGVEDMRADDTRPVIDAALLTFWEQRERIRAYAARNSLSCEFLVTVRVVFHNPLFEVSPSALVSLAALQRPLRFIVRDD